MTYDWQEDAMQRHKDVCNGEAFTECRLSTNGILLIWLRCDKCGQRFVEAGGPLGKPTPPKEENP